MEELKVVGETTQFIVIKLGDEQYGIDIKYIDNARGYLPGGLPVFIGDFSWDSIYFVI